MAAGVRVSPIPVYTDLIATAEDATGKQTLTARISARWINWLREIVDRVNRTAEALVKEQVLESSSSDLEGSIALTALPVGVLSAGLYRISVYARITRPATTDSSLEIVLGWSDGGVACTFQTTAAIANLPTTVVSESKVVRIQDGSPLTYETIYTSNGATTMQYSLDFVVERL